MQKKNDFLEDVVNRVEHVLKHRKSVKYFNVQWIIFNRIEILVICMIKYTISQTFQTCHIEYHFNWKKHGILQLKTFLATIFPDWVFIFKFTTNTRWHTHTHTHTYTHIHTHTHERTRADPFYCADINYMNSKRLWNFLFALEIIQICIDHLSFFWCLGRSMRRDCDIFWISSLVCFII